MTLFNTHGSTTKNPVWTLEQCTIAPPTEVAAFFEETNKLVALYKNDSLFIGLVKGLRNHCNALIPMASKQYKTQGNNCTVPFIILPAHEHGNLIFEIGHDGGHVVSHGVHYFLHLLHLNDLIHITEASLHAIPVLGVVVCAFVKAMEIWHEHHVLHQIETQLAKFHDFSPQEHDALYQFVIAKTLNTLKHQRNLAPHPKGWHFLLLTQSLVSLSNIDHHFDTLTEFGEAWSHDIIKQFIAYGVYMQDTNETIYKASDIAVALQVQTIFSASNYDIQYLNKTFSRFNALEGPLQKGICEILNPYSIRVGSTAADWVSHLHYRPNELIILKSYYARFNQVFELLNQTQPDLNRTLEGVVQLNLIASMLKGYLDKMAYELVNCWYAAELKTLVIKMNELKINSICKPISQKENDEVVVNDPVLACEIWRLKANQLATKLETNKLEHDDTKLALNVSQLENESLKNQIKNHDLTLELQAKQIAHIYKLIGNGKNSPAFFTSGNAQESSQSSSASYNPN